MIKPEKPSNEAQRIEALQRYQILDTLAEQAYNDITKIASAICETQIAVISLVDTERQWFKSIVGLDATETPRDVAFCAHAILKNEVMVVPDATLDDRFHDNPLVVGDPQIKFYAGAPLVTTSGHALGTLCVIDRQAKQLSPYQFEILEALSRQVMHLLELRLNVKALGLLAEDLAREKNQSVKLAQVKSDFLANMSHEIRTPMNGIIGMAEILRQTPMTQDQEECANYIESSAQHLMTLLNDILDYSKIEAGMLTIERTDFHLKNLLGDIEKTFSFQAKQKGIGFKVEFPQTHYPLMGDPTRVKQILINFVSNAIKFTDKGAVTIRVTEVGKSRYRWEVIDSGIGIPESATHMLFKEFSQVDTSTTRKYGGSGLGLSICKRLAQMMDGEVGVSSQPGQGSCFWFELQLPENRNAKPLEEKKITAVKVTENAFRILVVDDHNVNRIVASKILNLLGYSSVAVANGLEAVEAVKNDKFDLILMDCQMDVMDGYEATRQIRALADADKRQIPIVALTATTRKEDFEKCLENGMSDYLSKPFTREQLETKLRTQLKSVAS